MTPLLATSPREEMVLSALFALFLGASATIWTWILVRWRRSEPIIPLARRRPVPWHAQDVLFLFFMALLLPIAAASAVQKWRGPEAAPQAADPKPELAHPAEQLLRTGAPGEKAVAVVIAVIVAPLIEEFFFRVLLQGWLEAVWSRRRRKYPELRSAPASWLPIVLPAALFALMHLRSSKGSLSNEYLTVMFLAQMAADLLVLSLAIAVLRFAVGAAGADFGWQPEELRSDARLGLLALLATAPPVLAVHVALTGLVDWNGIGYAPDPIPLFLLALVLGTLYRRTHRLAPSLVLHAAFNATSIVLCFAGL